MPRKGALIIQPAQYRRIVKASAWYDLFATAVFSTPWTFAALHGVLALAAQGLPGSFSAFDPSHVLMANLLGSIVVIWAVLRLRDPQQQYGRYDAVGRFLFPLSQIYAVVHGARAIILGFTVLELTLGLLQSLPVDRPRA